MTGEAADPRVEHVRAVLRRHAAADEREADSLLRLLSGLDELPAPFDESADHTHVTASGIVVSRRGVVLHKHRRLHRWLQPGGHVDAGELPEHAALRETTEETGLPAHHPAGGPLLIHVDVHPAAKGHLHLDLRYLLQAAALDPAPPPGESQDVAWFSWEGAADVADDALTGALRAARHIVESPGWRWGEDEGTDGTDHHDRHRGDGRDEGSGVPGPRTS